MHTHMQGWLSDQGLLCPIKALSSISFQFQRLVFLVGPAAGESCSPRLSWFGFLLAEHGTCWSTVDAPADEWKLEILACCSRSCTQVQKQPSFVVIMPAELSCPP
ncbi:hypothetical protein SRHO_G00073670 [Serrasalmus rhombeus]